SAFFYNRVQGVISEQDIVIGVNGSRIAEPSIAPAPGGPTYVRLTGSQQVTRPATGSRSTITLPFHGEENIALAVAPWVQDAGGGLSDSGATSDPAVRTTSEGTTTIEKDGQTVISSHTESS